nr:YbjN domain-containing protein [uncultured Janthinobacterium sp.]
MTTLATITATSTATAAEFLLQHLKAEGYQAQTDSDGDIVFRFEGMGYVLCLDADDIQFGKLLLPNVWPIETPQEQQRVLAALDEVNRRIKLVKGHVVRGQVWFCIEMLLLEQQHWAHFLPRATRSMAHAASLFAGEMCASAE